MNVQTFMRKFKTPKLVEEYVKSGLIYYGEIPFLFHVFEPTTVRSSKEKGGYKVVSNSPPFQTKQSGAYLLARLTMDCSRTKQFWILCWFTMGNEASSSICQRLHRQEATLLGYLPSFAPLYESQTVSPSLDSDTTFFTG